MTSLRFADDAAASDLRTFASRARRLDDAAALRLVAAGEVLAVYASALHGAGGPTVLGLRTQQLAAQQRVELDVTIPAAALLDRLAASAGTTGPADPSGPADPRGGAAPSIQIPDLSSPQAAWAGLLPPRSGWSFEGLLAADVLVATATAGIDEVAAGTPEAAGSAAVARLRALVWGRDLAATPGLPAGVAFAADAFGFVRRGGAEDAITLHRGGAWWRLSTTRGHVLARTGGLL